MERQEQAIVDDVPCHVKDLCHGLGLNGWPSGSGGYHGDSCQFMKSRPSEFTPAMLAARTPDAVTNHPGFTNVQRANVSTSSHCLPCTSPPISECPSPPTLVTIATVHFLDIRLDSQGSP
jgi:hypothetical protein